MGSRGPREGLFSRQRITRKNILSDNRKRRDYSPAHRLGCVGFLEFAGNTVGSRTRQENQVLLWDSSLQPVFEQIVIVEFTGAQPKPPPSAPPRWRASSETRFHAQVTRPSGISRGSYRLGYLLMFHSRDSSFKVPDEGEIWGIGTKLEGGWGGLGVTVRRAWMG